MTGLIHHFVRRHGKLDQTVEHSLVSREVIGRAKPKLAEEVKFLSVNDKAKSLETSGRSSEPRGSKLVTAGMLAHAIARGSGKMMAQQPLYALAGTL